MGDTFAKGNSLEATFATYLSADGYRILPCHQFYDGYIFPDLLAMKSGRSIWVECKNKNRMRMHPATGFETRLWSEYHRIQEDSGIPILLVFQDQESLYANWLSEADRHQYRRMVIQGRQHILYHVPDAFHDFHRGESFEQWLLQHPPKLD